MMHGVAVYCDTPAHTRQALRKGADLCTEVGHEAGVQLLAARMLRLAHARAQYYPATLAAGGALSSEQVEAVLRQAGSGSMDSGGEEEDEEGPGSEDTASSSGDNGSSGAAGMPAPVYACMQRCFPLVVRNTREGTKGADVAASVKRASNRYSALPPMPDLPISVVDVCRYIMGLPAFGAFAAGSVLRAPNAGGAVTGANCHPKLWHALRELQAERADPNLHAIIFARTRHAAVYVSHVLCALRSNLQPRGSPSDLSFVGGTCLVVGKQGGSRHRRALQGGGAVYAAASEGGAGAAARMTGVDQRHALQAFKVSQCSPALSIPGPCTVF